MASSSVYSRPRDANAIRQSYTPSPILSSRSPSPLPSLLSSARRPSYNPPTPDQPPSYSFHRPPSTSPFLDEQDTTMNSSHTSATIPPSFSSSSFLFAQRPSSSLPLTQSQLGPHQDYPSRQPSPSMRQTSQPSYHTTQPEPHSTSLPPSYSRSQSSYSQQANPSAHSTFSSLTKNAKDNKAPPSSYSSSILASRYASLRPPSSTSVPPTYPRPAFDTQGYFVGVWKRVKWDHLGDPPLTLNGSGGFLHLDTYDSDDGPVFKWIPFRDAQHPTDWYYLECDECKLNYVTSKLRMTDSIDHAAIWKIDGYQQFRGEKGDISIKVYSEDGLILCSSIQEKSVALLTEEQADIRDASGNYLYNNAWECSPETSDDEASSWLNEYLGDDFEDSDLKPDLPSFLFEKSELT